MRLTYVFTIFFLFIFSNSFSQDTKKEPNVGVYVEVGSGPLLNGGDLDFGLTTWLTVAKNNNLYKIRFQTVGEFSIFGDIPYESTKTFALMIGKRRGNKIVKVGASMGLGITHQIYRGELIQSAIWFGVDEYRQRVYDGVSLPLELDVVFTPIEIVGFGFAITGDVNPKSSSLGFMLKIGIGVF